MKEVTFFETINALIDSNGDVKKVALLPKEATSKSETDM